MKPPVVFLDVDGVLIHRKCFVTGSGSAAKPDPRCIERVNRITDATGAGIVLSSSWRTTHKKHRENLKENRELLQGWGITGRLLGYTQRLEGRDPLTNLYVAKQRGDEILAWLLTYGDVPYVILDDDKDMGAALPHLVKTSFETGLLDKHVERAIDILRNGGSHGG